MISARQFLLGGMLALAAATAAPSAHAQKIYGQEGSADATMSNRPWASRKFSWDDAISTRAAWIRSWAASTPISACSRFWMSVSSATLTRALAAP